MDLTTRVSLVQNLLTTKEIPASAGAKLLDINRTSIYYKTSPEQVYELCYKEISESCAQAKDRREYKKITKNIAQLIKWKGNDTAKSLIEELKQRYPRKPALLDELEKVEKKL